MQKYSSLPYHYPVIAVEQGSKERQKQLFDYERPIAQLTSLTANGMRDPKKQKPYRYEDFSFYMPREAQDLPDGAYGAAMLTLVKRGKLPPWALFCFKQLTATASDDYEPAICALQSEDAILLHPRRTEMGYEGLLIAQESASSQRRVFVDDNGLEVVLTVPHVHTKVIAEEDVTLLL